MIGIKIRLSDFATADTRRYTQIFPAKRDKRMSHLCSSVFICGFFFVLFFSFTQQSFPSAQTESQMRQRADAIAAKLRCPVCQNLSVADSTSFMANQIKDKIGKMLAEGKSEQEIIAYFQSKYGDWILLSPPRNGFDLTVWLLPFAGFLAGGIFLVMLLRSMQKKKPQNDTAPAAIRTKSEEKTNSKAENTVNDAVKKELEKFDY